jgi:hypothetical protein
MGIAFVSANIICLVLGLHVWKVRALIRTAPYGLKNVVPEEHSALRDGAYEGSVTGRKKLSALSPWRSNR